MQMSAARAGRGQSQIEPFGVEARIQNGGFERGLLGLDRPLDPLLRRIERLARTGAVFGRELAHLLAHESERALAAKRFHARRFQFLQRGGGSDPRQEKALLLLYGIV